MQNCQGSLELYQMERLRGKVAQVVGDPDPPVGEKTSLLRHTKVKLEGLGPSTLVVT